MAFKGGFLLKPVTTNTQNIANMLVQGTQAIEDKKLKIGQIASDLMKDTNKAIAEIPITGPADHPVLIQKASNELRNYMSNAYQKFANGEISLSELSMINSKVYGQATMMSKSQELVAKQNEDLEKGITEGKYSAIGRTLNYGVYHANSTGDNNESTLDVRVDEFGDFQLSQTHYLPTLDGVQKTTSPLTKTASLTQRLSPANGFAPPLAVDIESDVKTFIGNIKAKGFVSSELVDELDINGNLTGNKISQVRINPESDENIKSGIELAINSYQPEDIADIAHKFGMKTDMDRTYRPYTQERVKSRFSNLSIDNEGNPISIEPEDMLLKTSDDGFRIEFTDKQQDILEGFLRRKLYNAVDPQLKIFRDKATEEPTVADIQQINFTPSPINSNSALLNMARRQQSEFNKLRSEGIIMGIDAEGKMRYPQIEPELSALLTTTSGDGAKNKVIGLNVPSEISDKVLKLNVVSSTGQKIKKISQIVSVKRGDKLEILILGPSDIADISLKSKGGSEVQVGKKIDVSEAISLPLSDSQIANLYTDLWDKNNKFQELAKQRGYDRTSRHKDDTSRALEYRKALSFIISDYADQ
jgi:hypothetical protein